MMQKQNFNLEEPWVILNDDHENASDSVELVNQKRVWLLKQIIETNNSQTDFEIGFDYFFSFMVENLDSQTTKDFIYYHENEIGNPKLPNGDANFTYLIGKEFIVEDWEPEEDYRSFMQFLLKTAELYEIEQIIKENIEQVVQDGDITLYIVKLGQKWVGWDDINLNSEIKIFDTREQVIQYHKDRL